MIIRKVSWQEAIPIRSSVLWPDKPSDFCKVKGDEEATHYGVYVKEQLVSVASIYLKDNEARLRKFATLEEFQGQGIGTHLIHHIIEELTQNHIQYFWCDARSTAVSFYQRFGMIRFGEEFYKSNVGYFKMSIDLQAERHS